MFFLRMEMALLENYMLLPGNNMIHLLQPYFSSTSALLQPYFSPTSANVDMGPDRVRGAGPPFSQQPYFCPTSALFQPYIGPTSALLQP